MFAEDTMGPTLQGQFSGNLTIETKSKSSANFHGKRVITKPDIVSPQKGLDKKS
jgi:phage gp45-like